VRRETIETPYGAGRLEVRGMEIDATYTLRVVRDIEDTAARDGPSERVVGTSVSGDVTVGDDNPGLHPEEAIVLHLDDGRVARGVIQASLGRGAYQIVVNGGLQST
jgi:hypothetical protein